MEESGRRKKMRVNESEEGKGIGYFPCDVLCDLLSRLPVKSLSRFKCVSKGWLNLIKDDPFIQLHFNRSKQNGTGRFLRVCSQRMVDNNRAKSSCRFYTLDKQDNRVTAPNTRVGEVIPFRSQSPSSLPPSCNGLICYISRDNDIQVCNPITHQTITLPRPDFLNTHEGIDLEVMLGIGYDSNVKRYKVIVIWSTSSDSDVEIFTIGTKWWRKFSSSVSSKVCESLITNPFNQFAASSVYANGALYWYFIGFFDDDDGKKYKRYPPEIVSFDFAQEKFNLIPVPKDVDRMNNMCWILELEGHICLLERAEYGPMAKMYMLKENHEWVNHKIPRDLIWVGSILTNQDGLMPIVGWGNNEETLYSSVYNFEGQLIQPPEVHHALHMYDFEVGQFHQESLVSLTNTGITEEIMNV